MFLEKRKIKILKYLKTVHIIDLLIMRIHHIDIKNKKSSALKRRYWDSESNDGRFLRLHLLNFPR